MREFAEGYRDVILVLSVPGLYCIMLLAGRRLKRKHGVKLGLLYHLFSLAIAIYFPARLLELQWEFLLHLGAATIVLGACVVIALIDRYIWDIYFRQRHKVTVPKVLTEVARMVVLLVAVFFVLEFFYHQSIKGLLIAPGIAAVVIGLAMQDLMSNVIAGVALQIGKPFVQGEWLQVENNRFAQVIEINWRSTRLVTVDAVSIEIPNRELARQTIINLNRPLRRHAMRLTISLDYAAPPNRVKDVLLHAVANAKGVLPEPKPQAFLKNFGDSGIEYEVRFWLEEYDLLTQVSDAIRTNMWYSLRRHGIKIPFPVRTVQLERPARDKQMEVQTTARIILRQQPLFRCLSDDELDALLPRGRVIHFGRDEKLIRQGAQADSMFVLVDGEATVVVERNGNSTPVAFLRSGDCFGEMSLLTGEPRSATVIAQTDCEVVEIGKAVLARSLKENPALLAQLSELLARRQMENEGLLRSGSETTIIRAQQTAYAQGFVQKLRTFFEL
jgi:small-conductance mechanosensitive channel/CRP-like cAMP-binding protein